MPKKESKKFKYDVVLSIAGIEHKLKTDDIAEGLINFEPLKLGGKAIISITSDRGVFSTFLYPRQLRKLFSNNLSRQLFRKRVDTYAKPVK